MRTDTFQTGCACPVSAEIHKPATSVVFADSSHAAIIYLFIYYVIFTQEYPISAQHCSPWGSCISYMTIQTSISIHSVLIQ